MIFYDFSMASSYHLIIATTRGCFFLAQLMAVELRDRSEDVAPSASMQRGVRAPMGFPW